MERALLLAKEAAKEGEIPVGAVIVKDGRIIAEGKNAREAKTDVFSHAECEAIAKAQKVLGDWRLRECSMYVTLEPCLMCMGAIINSRISELTFAAYDLKEGAESTLDLSKIKNLPKIYGGIKEQAAKAILKEFFKDKR